MKKLILVLFVSVLITLPFPQVSDASSAPASIVLEDLLFEGDFLFDINGMYYVYGFGYPLNVLAQLEVSDALGKLGDLSLNGQRNTPNGVWDGTYFGHWAFSPMESAPLEFDMGVFPDLALFDSTLGFTLTGFNDALGMEGEIPTISGSYDGGEFSGSPVPIPATLLLLGSGLLGLVGLRKENS